MPAELTIVRPDDWHLHVRDGAALRAVVPHSARQFGRAIVMPNLRPPVVTVEQALAYRDRVLAAVPEGVAFEPLDDALPHRRDAAGRDAPGARGRRGRDQALSRPGRRPTATPASPICARSRRRSPQPRRKASSCSSTARSPIPTSTCSIARRSSSSATCSRCGATFPGLKIVLEHITTSEGAQYVAEAGAHTAATITAHHLLYNRNAIFSGGLRPHYYCLPVLKRERHRLALVAAATSGSGRFFLGTDSAPHPAALKEHASGCAGCYTAFSALELYAEAFEAAGALDQLEQFASRAGPAFYGLPLNDGTVTLRKLAWTLPEALPFGDAELKPLRGGETLTWRLAA